MHRQRPLLTTSYTKAAADAATAIETLVEHGAIAHDDLVDRGISVRDVSRRNQNYVVTVGEQPCAFCKLGRDAYGERAVRRECHRYALLAKHGLDGLAPELIVADTQTPMLALRFVEGPTATEALQAPGPASATAFHRLGARLAAVHHTAGGDHDEMPFALHLARPRLEDLETLTAGAVDALTILHGDAILVALVEQLADQWTGATLIHGDVRLENVILDRGVTLLDWESLGAGPPEWDLGFAWASAVKAWVFSLPEVADDAQLVDAAAKSGIPLEALQLAMASLWHGYIAARPHAATALLESALGCVAAGLAQAAIEACQLQPRLTRAAVLLLQLASNAAGSPERVAQFLFGPHLRLLPGAPIWERGR